MVFIETYWCVLRRVAGWVAGGCWDDDYILLLVSQWIRKFPAYNAPVKFGPSLVRTCIKSSPMASSSDYSPGCPDEEGHLLH